MGLIRNVGWALLSSVVERFSVIFVSILIARNFSVTEFSKYSLYVITMTAFTAAFAMGVSVHISKVVAGGAKTAVDVAEARTSNFLLSLLATASVTIYCAFEQKGALESALYVGTIFFLVNNVFYGGAIIGLGLFKENTIIVIISSATMFFFVGFAFLRNEINYAMFGYFISCAIVCLGGNFLVNARLKSQGVPEFIRLARSCRHLFKLLRDVYPLALVSLAAGSIMWVVGNLILQFIGELEFNLFMLAAQVYSICIFVPSVLSKALFSWSVDNRNAKIHLAYVAKIVFAGISLFLLSLFASSIFDVVYGKTYSGNGIFFSLFILCAAIFSPMNHINNLLVISNLYLDVMRNYIIWYLLIVCLCVLLLQFDFDFLWVAFLVGNTWLLMASIRTLSESLITDV